MRRCVSLVLPLTIAVLASCASPSPSAMRAESAPSGKAGVVSPSALPSSKVALAAITGQVTAPSSLVAAGGLNLIGNDGSSMVAAGAGNMVAAGGGNMVAAGAGNMVAAGAGNLITDGGSTYRLAQAAALGFKPVPRARVYLTLGDQVLPIAPVETDEQGNYRFPKVPAGITYQVSVAIITKDNKPGRLTSLVKADAKGAVADVTPITTMVCAVVVGDKKEIGKVDPETLRKTTEAVEAAAVKMASAGASPTCCRPTRPKHATCSTCACSPPSASWRCCPSCGCGHCACASWAGARSSVATCSG